jgi:type IV secretion system protein VirD4
MNPATKPPQQGGSNTGAKVVFGLIMLLLMTAAFAWLSGAFFLLLLKKNPIGQANFGIWLAHWNMTHDPSSPLFQDAPLLIKKLKTGAVLAGLAAYGVPLLVWLSSLQTKKKLHGDARFATNDEIRKAGLFWPGGILVGKQGSKYLSFPGQQFVLVAAPTRSGKGVGIVIPNLLTWQDSVVVLDIKQENFDITAGFRARCGQDVFLFNPFAEDRRSHRYNPLGYVRDDNNRIGDLQSIAKIFYPGEGKDSFFDDAAANLFLGFGLYLCETPERPRTLGELLRLSSGDGVLPMRDYIQSLLQKRSQAGAPLSKACMDALNRFCATSDNTMASIMASFNAPLSMWANPLVDAATSANDFDLRDVRKRRMSVYVGITPDHLHEAGRLLNLFFSQLVSLNTKDLPQKNPDLRYQCLLLMDEFTAMGKVQILAKAVSYMAGYNLRLLPIIQSPSQLVSVYGPEDARTFITNHALQVLFAPREQKDAEEYSEMLGYQTVEVKSRSRSIGGKSGGGRTINFSEQRRALMLPQEVKELGLWKEIITLENTKPILCDKIRYFDDPNFRSRLKMPPQVPLLTLDGEASGVVLPPLKRAERSL